LKNKKNIVVFIDWFAPGYKAGGPVRSCLNLVEHLKSEFNFYIITSDTDYGETEPYKNVVADKWNVLEEEVNVYYFSKKHISRSSIKQVLSQIKEVHRYYLNGMFSYHFSLLPLAILKGSQDIILASRGMLASSALSLKPLKKNVFIKVLKALGFYKSVLFHATSLGEIEDIKAVIGVRSKIYYAPNLSRSIGQTAPERIKGKDNARLLFLGRISPEKNLLFALNILKNVKRRVTFDIYGAINDKAYWEQCRNCIASLPANISVSYKGIIESENVFKAIGQYDFLFLPTLGENFGHAIFESLSAGCPVIISNKTPWRNLQKNNMGWDLALDNEGEFINIIEKCSGMENENYQQMSTGARSFADSYIKTGEALELNRKLFE